MNEFILLELIMVIVLLPVFWGISILMVSFEMIPKGWWRLSQFKWYRLLRGGDWYFDNSRSVYHDDIYPRWRRGKEE